MVQGCVPNKTKKTESPPSFIQSAEVCEPGTVLHAKDTPVGQDRRQNYIPYKREHKNEYRKCPFRHDMCCEEKERGAAVLNRETQEPWDSLGKHPWKKTQQVQGSWDRTSQAEAPPCIHSLWGLGRVFINGQVQPSVGCGKTGGTGTHWRSRGNGRAHFSPFFFALTHWSLAWGQRDQNIQTGVRKKWKWKCQLLSHVWLCDHGL